MFEKFPKLHRLNGPVIVTEKIDGTNAQILIQPCTEASLSDEVNNKHRLGIIDELEVYAGSRTRFLSLKEDNFGFARFVYENLDRIVNKLGLGHHYGEWWGKGIQRGYDLDHKKFSLFNTSLWGKEDFLSDYFGLDVVPVLHEGIFDSYVYNQILNEILKTNGSFAAPGYMNPEGIVIYDTRSGVSWKKTFEYDDTGKNKSRDIDDNLIILRNK